MLRTILILIVTIILCFTFAAISSDESESPIINNKPGPKDNLEAISIRSFPSAEYWPSSSCRNCHNKIYDQHLQSMHAKSFINPVFQAEYFRELLTASIQSPELVDEVRACIACHSPISYVKSNGFIISEEQVDQRRSGVTCDFCHTIRAYKGKKPGGGNYVSVPGDLKLGPFQHRTNWHHAYSELQTQSEFCGICHNRINRYGLEIMSTYSEWKSSKYAAENIQCQDCHMNIQGFLTAGKPIYETGKAARMRLGSVPYRPKLYTHRFPGAHSKSQVVGALTMDISVELTTVSPGEDIIINVFVDNSKTGHKMPSGSAELRFLLLDFNAHFEDKIIPVMDRLNVTTEMYDVTGKSKSDSEILGEYVPEGRRIYRAICVDNRGERVQFSYDAVKIVFDNRLDASEVRKETYRFRIPEDAAGIFILKAHLYYFSYPHSFAKRLGLPEAEAVQIAYAEKEMLVK